MRIDFSNKAVIVTGAASGIGLAIARRLLQSGAVLWMSDVDEMALSGSKGALEAEGLAPRARVCDVRNADDVDALVGEVIEAHGRLDVLVNNVGVTHFAPVVDTGTEAWRATVEVTLDSCFYGVRAALRPMLAQGGGAIVNVSSGAGLLAVPEQGAYGAAKAGVIHLTRTAAVENGASGVRINCVVPGPIDTPPVRRWLESMPDGGASYERTQVAGRLGQPEEIAHAVAFLASAQASFINGAALAVDGGVSAKLATGL